MPPLFGSTPAQAYAASLQRPQQLQQPVGPNIQDILFGGGNSGVDRFGTGNGGFAEGQSDTLDWANLLAGDTPVLGPILGLLSRQSAARSAQQAQDRANQANERRYGEILGLNTQQQQTAQNQLNQTGQYLANRVGQVQDAVGQQGETARRDIRSAGIAQQGRVAQDMQRGGLTNSTVNRQAQLAAGRNTDRSLADLNERIGSLRGGALERTTGDLGNFMQNRTGFESGLLGQRAGAIERRTDQADLRDLIPALMAGKSSGGGGSGGGSFLGSLLGGLF